MTDRSALIRLASTLPPGSPERKNILARLTKEAAAHIELWDLPPAQTELVNWLAKFKHIKPGMAFSGAHGYVVDFNNVSFELRFSEADLKKLMSTNVFRWIEFDATSKSLSVGM